MGILNAELEETFVGIDDLLEWITIETSWLSKPWIIGRKLSGHSSTRSKERRQHQRCFHPLPELLGDSWIGLERAEEVEATQVSMAVGYALVSEVVYLEAGNGLIVLIDTLLPLI